MPIDGIVFDLDDTLLDTGILREARDQKDWSRVKAGLERVGPFPAPEGSVSVESLPARLRADGVKIGILTDSPRWYAEVLLRRFDIPTDAMITGSDPYPPKPDPTSLRQISTELGIDVSRCVYVGDRETDAAAAAAAGLLSVGACWSGQPPQEWRRWWPDIAVASPDRLLDPEQLKLLRPLAEVVLAGSEPVWHWGTLMHLDHDVFACGRYFVSEDVDRHPGHALSALVLKSKNDPSAGRRAADILSRLSERPPGTDRPPEIVVSVPSKPGQEFDRFGEVRAALAAALGGRDGEGILSMAFDVSQYKHMSPDERHASNRNRFQSLPLHGEKVLLFDDVITSGGQTAACREALIGAGAGRVIVLALAATQNRLPEACPYCGAHLRTYRRHSDDRPFIGCPNFFTTGCRYKRDAGDQPI